MRNLLSIINTFIGNRQYFLRVVFFVSACVSAYEGITMPYLMPDFKEVGEMRTLIVVSYFCLVGITFRKDWEEFDFAFFLGSMLMIIWITLLFLENGIFERLEVWLFLTLFAWGYVIEDIRLLHFQQLIYLVCTLIMISIIEEPFDVKAGFLTLSLPFFFTSYFILINLKRNKQQLIKLNSALSHKSQVFEKAQRIALMGNWEFDFKTMEFSGSAQLYNILELEENQKLDVQECLALFEQKDYEQVLPAILTCRNEGIPFDLKLPMKTFKGNNTFIRFAGFGEMIDGRSTRLYGMCQDLSAEYQAEQDLLKAKDEAEQANIAKSQFLSVMSHEIRTPMNAVIGSTHLLYEDNPREDQKDVLQTLNYSAENLLYLINDILDYSKIEAGGVEIEQISFDLPKRIENIINTFSFQAQEKALDLRAEILEPLPKWVLGDPTRIGQIITNLLGNALKFTEEGEVVVRVRQYKEEGETHWIKIEVTDTGIGIPQNKLSHIFDQFTQAESDTTRKYGGTGLGLAISKKLLELMGSEIKVISQVGLGTTFHFTLPLKTGQEAIEEVNLPKNEQEQLNPATEVNILLAEDNLVNVKIACKFLDKWGFTTSVVNNGLEAVEKVSSESFDLILMDLQMPEMGGIEATQEIRNLGYDLPIIALSAEVSEHVRDRVIAAGMDDYSSKPFVPKDLRQKILSYTRRVKAS